MPAPHVPNLDSIARVNDTNARFYAIIGVLVSLSAALEQTMFEIFAVGIRMGEEDAALIYYRVRSDEARAGMTDAAIRAYLKGHPQMVAEWEALRKRMGPKSEQAGYRNLVAHNPVNVTFAVAAGMGFSGFSFSGAPAETPWPQVSHSVHQDPVQVKAAGRPDRRADFAKLRESCETLIQLHLDLTDWLQRLP